MRFVPYYTLLSSVIITLVAILDNPCSSLNYPPLFQHNAFIILYFSDEIRNYETEFECP